MGLVLGCIMLSGSLADASAAGFPWNWTASIRWENGTLALAIDPSAGFWRTVRTIAVPELHSLRLLVDESALELFVNSGERVMASRFFPKSLSSLRLEGTGQMTLYDMKPMEMIFTC